MAKTDKTLLFGEKIIHQTKLHPVIVWGPVGLIVFAASVATGAMIVLCESLRLLPVVICSAIFIGGITWLLRSIRRAACDYVVTNKRILVAEGVLTLRNVEIFLSKIESIEIQQDLIGCMIGFGTIIICGTGGTKQQFTHIDHPMEFRKQCQQQMDGLRSLSYMLN